ncbi:dihydropteroate synthase [Paenibacillus sp. GCM10027626]|uniref:dihydropteroate synthase n=1 Tax=Paenibacillus sp. GCM10027626 TaxID=3273411 RepID=UPI003627F13F
MLPVQRKYEMRSGVTLTLGQRTLIMGILNATPDSFSDGGQFNTMETAVAHAREMAAAGADMIDIGGESTRPGHEPVSAQEEIDRVVPIIAAVRQTLPHMAISIDTYKAATARAALEAGADIINDVWGCKADPLMAEVAGEYGCPVILNHNRADSHYRDLMPELIADLQQSIAIAKSGGVEDNQIWLDPGIGFAKTREHNLYVMGHLDEIAALGYPVLLGTSRKRFIRETLQVPVEEAIFGTAATVTLGIAQGCQIVRVHDVLAMKRNALMADAIIYGTRR